jgi:uncharacterized protein (TIGR00730 family)
MKICVYCASSPKVDEAYFDAASRLGTAFVAGKVSVVFGGGATGLMGKLADTVIALGGKIKGIMPKFMNEVEWAHKGVTDFEFTESMHERKARFLIGIDAVVALPGGTGTLEELFEVITLKRLGQFAKPIVIVNTKGFYDPLKQMLDRCIEEAFMHPKHRELWTFVDEPEQVLDAIRTAQPWGSEAIAFARNT